MKGQLSTLEDHYLDLSGKAVIVTGANLGIGKESAKKFAEMMLPELVSSPLNANGTSLLKIIIRPCDFIDPCSKDSGEG